VGKTILEKFSVTPEFLTELVHENPSLRGMLAGYIAEKKLHEIFVGHGKTEGHRKDDDHDRLQKGDLVLTYKNEEFRIEVKSLQTNTVKFVIDGGKDIPLVKKREIGRKVSPGSKKNGLPRMGAPIYKVEFNPDFEALSDKEREEGTYSGCFQCDASDKRPVKLDGNLTVNTTLLKVNEFDIVAAGIFSFRDKWEFGFALNEDLPKTKDSSLPPEAREQLIASLVKITYPLQPPFESDPFKLLDRLVERRQLKKSVLGVSETQENTSDFFAHELESEGD
jgi:hypothetical protein